jgi:hypothetical protein
VEANQAWAPDQLNKEVEHILKAGLERYSAKNRAEADLVKQAAQ